MTAQVIDFMFDSINCISVDICSRGLFVMSIIEVTMVVNLK